MPAGWHWLRPVSWTGGGVMEAAGEAPIAEVALPNVVDDPIAQTSTQPQ
jgi:hypothetical protein